MKILVRDLRPNPFRHFEKYPIMRDKVESLKCSISETDFWDNVLARESPGKDGIYEIAYGHHRLTALRELGIKEVDIPIRSLDDATMIRIMANENLDTWKTTPAVINETVAVTKDFIDSEMAKAETWEASNNSIRCLFSSDFEFKNTKGKGAGQTTILKFLGGNWKQWMVQEALATIEDVEVEREAVEQFPTLKAASTFRLAVKKAKVPKKKQKELARKIIKQDRASRREIEQAVEDNAGDEAKSAFEDKHPRIKPELNDLIAKHNQWIAQIIDEQKEILAHPEYIDPEVENKFLGLVSRLISMIREKGKRQECKKLLSSLN